LVNKEVSWIWGNSYGITGFMNCGIDWLIKKVNRMLSNSYGITGLIMATKMG